MGSAFHQLCQGYSGTLTPAVGLLPPLSIRLLGYGKPLPFLPIGYLVMAEIDIFNLTHKLLSLWLQVWILTKLDVYQRIIFTYILSIKKFRSVNTMIWLRIDGRMERRTDGRTDKDKSISFCLRRGIKRITCSIEKKKNEQIQNQANTQSFLQKGLTY